MKSDRATDHPPDGTLSRRQLLAGAGYVVGASAWPRSATAEAGAAAVGRAGVAQTGAGERITDAVARYMVASRAQSLSPDVLREARHRVLDTLGAMVSGGRLKPGEAAIKFVRSQGGVAEASVVTTNIKTTAINAALANGMFGHADETDDFEPVTKAHPGCAVVPAALAMGERAGVSGRDLLHAVILGYDLCCRFLMALDPDHVRATHRSAEGTSATFGAAAAAAGVAGLNETQMRYVLSYAAQQVSGLWSWVGDEDHIEKAFDFGGMGARNGVAAAAMVQSGFTGVSDILDGQHNVLQALSTKPRPEAMVADLGQRFYVTETAIKTYSVGYPIQAPLDAFFRLREQYGLTVDNVERIVVRLPEDGARIVDNSAMPDVNCQHLIALGLVRGAVTFLNSHERELMTDPRIRAVRDRVQLVADRSLMVPDAPRSGHVEVTLRDGRSVSHFTKYAPGTKENPIDADSLNAKVRDLMEPVLGAAKTAAVIRQVHALDTLPDVRALVANLVA
ncbi:MAG: MmgE/PrpD family protein [Vicinamibacterales bacterium]